MGIYYDYQICNGATFGVLNPHGATQWQWRWGSGSGTLGSPNSQATYGNLYTGGGVIEVRAKNLCGWSDWTGKTIIVNCNNLLSSWVRVAGNPAQSSFTVMFSESTQVQRNSKAAGITDNMPFYDIKLYSWNMELIRQATSRGEDVIINTADLPSHIYFLYVDNGVETEKIQVLVEH